MAIKMVFSCDKCEKTEVAENMEEENCIVTIGGIIDRFGFCVCADRKKHVLCKKCEIDYYDAKERAFRMGKEEEGRIMDIFWEQ